MYAPEVNPRTRWVVARHCTVLQSQVLIKWVVYIVQFAESVIIKWVVTWHCTVGRME